MSAFIQIYRYSDVSIGYFKLKIGAEEGTECAWCAVLLPTFIRCLLCNYHIVVETIRYRKKQEK